MIHISKPRAFRAASKLAASVDRSLLPNLALVALHADGSLSATNGVAMILSRGAHDGSELFLRPGFTPSPGALGYRLDVEAQTIVEERARSETEHPAEILAGVHYPDVFAAASNGFTYDGCPPAFDSILAGRVAADYGLERGVWRKGSHPERVYLDGVDEGDEVILAGVKLDK